MNCEKCPFREDCTIECVNGYWLCTAQRKEMGNGEEKISDR